MEVKLEKRYPLNASVAQAWAVLSDIRATAACMPGATITEQLDDTHFKGTVKSKVGPATMNFGGDIEVLALDAATYSMQMLGKGADRSGSSASMNLSSQIVAGDSPGTSVLVGNATVIVSGKLAQFGSRLLVPVSEAILGQFAGHFETAAAAVPVAAPTADTAASEVPPSPAAISEEAPATDGRAMGAETASHPVEHKAPTPVPAPSTLTPVAAPKPAGELNALALLWILIKGWFAGLFGKKS
ncbi:MAG: carbon monoxide dehydrogenase [Betaproteobacteria bacterium]|jgi:carbon monoxide dehydrogenase subunit G|nr:carbon monoxide dehydrogenase [Betaproteobacteria bacterium]